MQGALIRGRKAAIVPDRDQDKIITSHKGIQTYVISAGVVTLLICLGVTWLVVRAPSQTGIGTLLLGLTWIGLPIVWLISAWLAYLRDKKKGYFLTDDALIVRGGGLASVHEELYRYDSMLAVSVNQGLVGKSGGYGTISITIPKLDTPVVLRYVMNPEAQAMKLKARISGQGSRRNSLVS